MTKSDNSGVGKSKLADRFRWLLTDDFQQKGRVVDKLRDLYLTKLLPIEKQYFFEKFHSPPMGDADFDPKPMVLVVGQYSTGKSTLIR